MKKLLFSLAVLALVLSGCSQKSVSELSAKPSVNDKKIEQNQEVKCSKKGEPAYTTEQFYSQEIKKDNCCQGLKPMSGYGLTDGKCERVDGPFFPCMPCGDGVCEFGANENICNCPEDCKKATKDCAGLHGEIQGEEGAKIWSISWLPKKCCDDLKPVYTGGAQRASMVCIKCGDGICANDQYEQWQTCPEDCSGDPDYKTKKDLKETFDKNPELKKAIEESDPKKMEELLNKDPELKKYLEESLDKVVPMNK